MGQRLGIGAAMSVARSGGEPDPFIRTRTTMRVTDHLRDKTVIGADGHMVGEVIGPEPTAPANSAP
jgi:hypothetical protein